MSFVFNNNQQDDEEMNNMLLMCLQHFPLHPPEVLEAIHGKKICFEKTIPEPLAQICNRAPITGQKVDLPNNESNRFAAKRQDDLFYLSEDISGLTNLFQDVERFDLMDFEFSDIHNQEAHEYLMTSSYQSALALAKRALDLGINQESALMPDLKVQTDGILKKGHPGLKQINKELVSMMQRAHTFKDEKFGFNLFDKEKENVKFYEPFVEDARKLNQITSYLFVPPIKDYTLVFKVPDKLRVVYQGRYHVMVMTAQEQYDYMSLMAKFEQVRANNQVELLSVHGPLAKLNLFLTRDLGFRPNYVYEKDPLGFSVMLTFPYGGKSLTARAVAQNKAKAVDILAEEVLTRLDLLKAKDVSLMNVDKNPFSVQFEIARLVSASDSSSAIEYAFGVTYSQFHKIIKTFRIYRNGKTLMPYFVGDKPFTDYVFKFLDCCSEKVDDDVLDYVYDKDGEQYKDLVKIFFLVLYPDLPSLLVLRYKLVEFEVYPKNFYELICATSYRYEKFLSFYYTFGSYIKGLNRWEPGYQFHVSDKSLVSFQFQNWPNLKADQVMFVLDHTKSWERLRDNFLKLPRFEGYCIEYPFDDYLREHSFLECADSAHVLFWYLDNKEQICEKATVENYMSLVKNKTLFTILTANHSRKLMNFCIALISKGCSVKVLRPPTTMGRRIFLQVDRFTNVTVYQCLMFYFLSLFYWLQDRNIVLSKTVSLKFTKTTKRLFFSSL